MIICTRRNAPAPAATAMPYRPWVNEAPRIAAPPAPAPRARPAAPARTPSSARRLCENPIVQAVASTAVPPSSNPRSRSICASTGQKIHAAAAAPAKASIPASKRVGRKAKSMTMPASGAANPSRIILRVAVSGAKSNPAMKYTAVANAATTASPPRRKGARSAAAISAATKGARPPCTAGLASISCIARRRAEGFGGGAQDAEPSFLRNRIGKRRSLRELGERPREIGVTLLPVHLGIPEIEPAQADPDGDVGEAVTVPHAPGFVAQIGIHCGEPGADFPHLALDPRRAPQLRLALVFQPREHSRVQHAVGERFPAPRFDALAVSCGYQPRNRRSVVQKPDDHARVEQRPAVVEHERGYLAERVELRRFGVGFPRVIDLEVVVDFLFSQHDAHLARIRACERADQFHLR